MSHSDFFSISAESYLSEILCNVINIRGCINVSFKAETVEWACIQLKTGDPDVNLEASSGIAPSLRHSVQMPQNLMMPLVLNCRSISFSHRSLRYFFKGERSGVQFLVRNLVANLLTKSDVTIKIDNEEASNYPEQGFYNQLRRHYFYMLKYWFADEIAQTGNKTLELLTINTFFPINGLLTGYLKRQAEEFRMDMNMLQLDSQDHFTIEQKILNLRNTVMQTLYS